jgi:hypothetical protein
MRRHSALHFDRRSLSLFGILRPQRVLAKPGNLEQVS